MSEEAAAITLDVEPINKPVDIAPNVQTAPNEQTKNNTGKWNKNGGRFNGKKRYDGRSKRRGWEPIDRRGNDDDAKRVRINPEDRVKRRKYCMLMGFAGANYCGMQRNPDVNTIEEEVLKALHKNKLIADDAFQVPQNIQFQRAARTDKGVSAARQCCSLKLRKFQGSFVWHRRILCALTNFSFSGGITNIFTKIHFIFFNTAEEVDLEQLNKDLPDEIKIFKLIRVTKGFNAKEKCDARSYSYTLPSMSFVADQTDLTKYRIDEATLGKVNEALGQFEGTHNFHNFTSKKAFSDASAVRFMHEFKCGQPFLVNDVEFCELSVKGQSFMLHQIRKMVGLTIAAVRGVTSVDTISRSFQENRLDLPMAPGLGLVLNEVYYDRYNERYGEDGMHELLVWSDVDEIIQEFREKFIHAFITKTEVTEQPMQKWIETLTLHSYSERPEELEKAATNTQNNDEDDE